MEGRGARCGAADLHPGTLLLTALASRAGARRCDAQRGPPPCGSGAPAMRAGQGHPRGRTGCGVGTVADWRTLPAGGRAAGGGVMDVGARAHRSRAGPVLLSSIVSVADWGQMNSMLCSASERWAAGRGGSGRRHAEQRARSLPPDVARHPAGTRRLRFMKCDGRAPGAQLRAPAAGPASGAYSGSPGVQAGGPRPIEKNTTSNCLSGLFRAAASGGGRGGAPARPARSHAAAPPAAWHVGLCLGGRHPWHGTADDRAAQRRHRPTQNQFDYSVAASQRAAVAAAAAQRAQQGAAAPAPVGPQGTFAWPEPSAQAIKYLRGAGGRRS